MHHAHKNKHHCAHNTKEAGSILSFVYQISIVRSFLKWLIHLWTGTCELQRIVIKQRGAVRTIEIEKCLLRSKCSVLRDIVQVEPKSLDDSIYRIMEIKGIVSDNNPSFFPTIKTSLLQLHGYRELFSEIEQIREVKYCCENSDHEKHLLKLWDLLQPNEILKNRISRQWCNIGFQGDDPKTDFRGMGFLGLTQLVYFSEHYSQLANLALAHSHHPKYEYSYAIVGINLTSMAYELIDNGLLRSHFFNNINGKPTIEDFHEVYCYLFHEFDKLWIKSEPENVMEFGRIRDEFKQTIASLLSFAPSVNLNID